MTHDRGAAGVQRAEDVEHLGAGGRVEVAGGLVGQHDGRLADDGPGDGHPLALTARELRRAVPQAVGEPDPLERLGGAAPPLVGGTPR